MGRRLTEHDRLLRAKSEREWQSDVVGILHSFGWETYHTHDSRRSAAGFPDVVAIRKRSIDARPHDMLVAELKRETENPTSAQEHWLGLFTLAGVDAYIWRPRDVDDVIARAQGAATT